MSVLSDRRSSLKGSRPRATLDQNTVYIQCIWNLAPLLPSFPRSIYIPPSQSPRLGKKKITENISNNFNSSSRHISISISFSIHLHGSSSIFFHSSLGSNFFPISYQRQFHLLVSLSFSLIFYPLNLKLIGFFFRSFVPVSNFTVSQPLDRYTRRRGLVRPISAQLKRVDSVVPSAASTFAPGIGMHRKSCFLLARFSAFYNFSFKLPKKKFLFGL